LIEEAIITLFLLRMIETKHCFNSRAQNYILFISHNPKSKETSKSNVLKIKDKKGCETSKKAEKE